MRRTRIKICGITRPEDAHAAADAGTDAIGMVFYPQAKRCIDLATARRIIAVLPPFVTPVGLFVDADRNEIESIAAELHLTHLQLHGHETPELVAQLSGFTIIKSIPAHRRSLADQVTLWKNARLPQLRGLLMETPHTGQAGGSGVENDWAMIAEFARDGLFAGGPPLIAAGGLNPENVGVVVRSLRPWAVDVSSGVEEAFGQKSPAKIRDFVAAVRDADLK
jgi:phosphoribosylanthranilate isomerase